MASVSHIEWHDTYELIDPQIRADGVHVWPFKPACPVALVFQALGYRPTIRMNRHDYFELVYVLRGKVLFQFHQRFLTAKEGDLVAIGSNIFHRVLLPTRRKARVAALFFMPEAICGSGGDQEGAEYLMPFYAQGPDFPHVIGAANGVPARVFGLMEYMHSRLPPNCSRARLTLKTLLKAILVFVVNHYTDHHGTRDHFDQRRRGSADLRPLFEFIEGHYHERITVQDAASVLSFSRPHFMRTFKRATGQTFVSYLTHFRIAKGEALLASTDKPLSEVAQEIGYCDQSYFGAIFRKLVRMTPGEYRRRFGDPEPQN